MAEFSKMFDNAMNQDWLLIIFSFIFYFITGYLLYASVFAAIGSAVDNETETQQFMLPVTIPIILALMVAMGTMQNPESSVAFWFSMIPLTSPIVMMARIPCSILANRHLNASYGGYFSGICLDGCKSIPHRYPYVWQENILEGNVEVA
jgi:ABC-type Na+ efflux pump permease subunit